MVPSRIKALLRVPTVDADHTEGAWARATRELASFLHSPRFFFWAAVVELGTFAGCLLLGASANTKTVGAIVAVPMFVALLVGVLYTTAPIRQRDEARQVIAEYGARAGNFEISFSWDKYLKVAILNNGPSLNAALINFLVPDTIKRIYRLDDEARPARTGMQIATSEELAPGVTAIYWQEANIQLPGFGSSTPLYFVLPGFPDEEIPVSFRIGGDEIGGWLAFNLKIGPAQKPEKKDNEDAD